jgi:hypothetical protein
VPLGGKQSAALDVHERIVFRNGEVDCQWSYDDRAYMQSEVRKLIQRLTNLVRISSECSDDAPECRYERLSLPTASSLPLELTQSIPNGLRIMNLIATVLGIGHC